MPTLVENQLEQSRREHDKEREAFLLLLVAASRRVSGLLDNLSIALANNVFTGISEGALQPIEFQNLVRTMEVRIMALRQQIDETASNAVAESAVTGRARSIAQLTALGLLGAGAAVGADTVANTVALHVLRYGGSGEAIGGRIERIASDLRHRLRAILAKSLALNTHPREIAREVREMVPQSQVVIERAINTAAAQAFDEAQIEWPKTRKLETRVMYRWRLSNAHKRSGCECETLNGQLLTAAEVLEARYTIHANCLCHVEAEAVPS